MSVARRTFLLGATAAGASIAAGCAPFVNSHTARTALPPSNGKRVVVAGGGWGGLTAARHLRLNNPDLEIVLLERNPVFFSCPMSNKWLVDIVDTNFLMHEYLGTAKKYNYTFLQTEVTAIERDRRHVHTAHGRIDYDWLILAGGIRYNYDAWFAGDRRAADYTKAAFPAAYIPNAEHITLKKKVQALGKGHLVMTLPPPPHRCPPSPYERACLLAWHIKKHKLPVKITILDPKDSPRPITTGFLDAFTFLYDDVITYVPNARIREVDPFNKIIRASTGDVKFDDAILMAPHQAADMVWMADLIAKDKEGKPIGWGAVEPTTMQAKGDPNVFIIGDSIQAVSPQFGYYPKSGHIANRLGRIVARRVADLATGKQPSDALPDNLCYQLVNGQPPEAILVDFGYKLVDGVIHQTQNDINTRSGKLAADDFVWAKSMYDDMFA